MLDASSICVITLSPGCLASDGGGQCWGLNTVLHHAWWESSAVHCLDTVLTQISIKHLVWICQPVVTGTLYFVLKSVSGVPLFREQSNGKLLKFATQKYFKATFDRIVK